MIAWRDIEGFKGIYQVSECGNVRSVDRTSRCGKGTRKVRGRTLVQMVNPINGYHSLTLSSGKIRTKAYVHDLVAKAFIGERGDCQVNHIDGNKSNNHYANLEYVTVSENHKHAFRTGLKCNKGERNPVSKLTADDVRSIRVLLSIGEKQKDIARAFSISPDVISSIKKGNSWSHVKT